MIGRLRHLFILLLALAAVTARAVDYCAVCGQEIVEKIYLVRDKLTGDRKMVCSLCVKLPTCYICGIPVKDGTALPDGRMLCARDAKTAVLDADEAKRICLGIEDDLNHLFSRFTEFPARVDITAMDRVDVDSLVDTVGNTYESPDILGLYTGPETNGVTWHHVHLLTGQPLARLKEVCAHELSHAWVQDNVPKERRARLNRDAEEGFCEMVGYLLIESQHEDAEMKRVLANAYTRGQVHLFLEAERRYGFDQILDWMQYGETGRLYPGRLEEIRDVKMPPAHPTVASTRPAISLLLSNALPLVKMPPPSGPATLVLQSILAGAHPAAIINGRSFFAGDESKVRVGTNSITIRCLAIHADSVHIRNLASGEEKDLVLAR